MSFELYFTSAPKGLKPGTKGFCTVAASRGIPSWLTDRLESLSGYRPLFPPNDPNASDNPVNYCHYRISIGGKNWHILSRIAFAGLDYTSRSNKIAYHVAIEPSELPKGGPAWLISQPNFMAESWQGEPSLLAPSKIIPEGDLAPTICQNWAKITGDAGWAGLLADTLITDPSKTVYLIIPRGIDMLPLFKEAIALLPINQRWQATFSTYYATDLASDVRCAWRCAIGGTTMASKITNVRSALVIDLTEPRSLDQSGGMIDFARTGILNDQRPLQERTIIPMPTREVYSVIKPISTRNPGETYEILHPEGYQKNITKPPKSRQSEKSLTPSLRPAPVFWILATLWPIVVAGGVLVWIQASRTGEETAQITQPTSIPTSGPAESEDYKKKYQEEIEKHNATRGELEAAKSELEKLKMELSSMKPPPEAALIKDDKPANEAEPVSNSATASDSSPAHTSKVDPVVSESSSTAQAELPETNIGIGSLGILIVPIPDLLETIHPDDPITIKAEFDLSKLSNYEKLEPKFLNDQQKISTPDNTHQLKISWQESSLSVTHSSASAFGTNSDEEIFRLTYQGGKTWSCAFTDYFMKLKEKDIQIWAYQAIKTAAIRVEKDRIIQFCHPKREKWQLDKQDKVTLEFPLGIKSASDKLPPAQLSQVSASNWSVDSSENQLLFKRRPTTKKASSEEHSAEFHISIGSDDQKSYQLESNWMHKIQRLETQVEIIKKIDDLTKKLQSLITEITKNNNQNSPSQDTQNGLQKSIEQLNQNLEKLIQGNHLNAFRDIGIVWVPVRFPNGAIYQIFELITGK